MTLGHKQAAPQDRLSEALSICLDLSLLRQHKGNPGRTRLLPSLAYDDAVRRQRRAYAPWVTTLTSTLPRVAWL
jgi:hypothetical protein